MRDSVTDVAAVFAVSAVIGFDCVSTFELQVPIQECYQLVIDDQPVGSYLEEQLGADGDIGIITSLTIYGDPLSTDGSAPLYGDFNGCSLG